LIDRQASPYKPGSGEIEVYVCIHICIYIYIYMGVGTVAEHCKCIEVVEKRDEAAHRCGVAYFSIG